MLVSRHAFNALRWDIHEHWSSPYTISHYTVECYLAHKRLYAVKVTSMPDALECVEAAMAAEGAPL